MARQLWRALLRSLRPLVHETRALAKGLYYRRRVVGKLAAAPFVAIDAVTPQLRRIAVKRRRYAIADAHYALAFLRLGRMDPDAGHFERARSFLSALDAARSPLFDEPAWGYPFDWPSRHFMYRAESPLIPTMPYAYEAFAAGFDTLGDERWLDVAHGAATFVAERIPVTPVAPGVEASTYSPFDHRQVVNASAYRGFMLISAGIRFDRTDWRTAGAANIAFVLRSRQSDGSWPYSVDGGDNFIDNFHTCFVLKNLAKVQAATPDDELEDAIAAGYAFYLARLLDEQGLPRPYAQRPRLTLHRRDRMTTRKASMSRCYFATGFRCHRNPTCSCGRPHTTLGATGWALRDARTGRRPEHRPLPSVGPVAGVSRARLRTVRRRAVRLTKLAPGRASRSELLRKPFTPPARFNTGVRPETAASCPVVETDTRNTWPTRTICCH